jgi:hypothetical protein
MAIALPANPRSAFAEGTWVVGGTSMGEGRYPHRMRRLVFPLVAALLVMGARTLHVVERQ